MAAVRHDKALMIAGAVALVVGPLGAILLVIQRLVTAFGSVAHAPVENRARLLSEGISHAMWSGAACAAAGVVVGAALIAVAVVLRRRSPRER